MEHNKGHAEPHHARRKKSDTTKHATRTKLLIGGGSVLALALICALVLGLFRKSSVGNEADSRQKTEKAGKAVEVATVKASESERVLQLTGETRSFFSVTLYPRVSGYLDELHADIGDHVKKGQLLAHIQAPEQDQAYNSARADALNKRRIAGRMHILLKRNLISPQQEEQAESDADVAEANMRTQGVLKGYQNIVAPFDGIISNRFVDPGWLLQNASSSQAASQPLFTLSQTDRLRLFIYVDQKNATYVKVGDPVEIDVPNQPGQSAQTLTAPVTMIAGELDSRTRTLLAEILLDNPKQEIVPGTFVQARLKVATPSMAELPIQALIMRNKEAGISVVDADGHSKFTKIDLAENDGENILIRSGVKVGEKVALNVGNILEDGQKVRVNSQGKQAAGQAGASATGTTGDEAGGEAGKASSESSSISTESDKPSGDKASPGKGGGDSSSDKDKDKDSEQKASKSDDSKDKDSGSKDSGDGESSKK